MSIGMYIFEYRKQLTTETMKTTDIKTKGKQVTTINNLGGYGLGYLVDGVVYKATGSYMARKASEGPFPMQSYIEDGGQAYLDFLKK